jgi:glycosyltransferase involved in cell wall biosynthesis
MVGTNQSLLKNGWTQMSVLSASSTATTYLVYRHFYDPNTQQLMLGGIENYVLQLARLLQNEGQRCVVVQTANFDFSAMYQGIAVIGVYCGAYRGNRKKLALFQYIRSRFNDDSDSIIFATDSYYVKNNFRRTIAIQHGVSWDKPASRDSFFGYVKSLLNHHKYLSYIRHCRNLVCVDHNFVNWYRSYQNFPAKTLVRVIMNFSAGVISPLQLQQKWLHPLATPTLLIARRFVDYRGIALAISVVQKLLQKYPALQVTFAGEGPLETEIKAAFSNQPQVTICRYRPEEALQIHLQHDLVLLPSIGSEGTSLSLAEAMAAGCAVVSTNVGGLSNMIIDQFNGLIGMPDTDALVSQLDSYLQNPHRAKQLAFQGYATATSSLSLVRWQQEWLQFFTELGFNFQSGIKI